MAGLQNRYNTGPLNLMTTGLGGGMSREELIRQQKEREELERQRRARILAAGPARGSGAVDPRLTIEINEGVPRFTPQPGKGGAPSGLYGVPQRVRGLGTGSEAYKPAGPRGGQLTGPMAQNPLVPARQTPMKEEEDEYGFLDAMFLANLVAGMQGGPPPTPYGTAVGGGNKTWASLPSLMRMS